MRVIGSASWSALVCRDTNKSCAVCQMLRSIWQSFSKSFGRSLHQRVCEGVLTFDHAGQVDGRDMAVAHNLAALDQ